MQIRLKKINLTYALQHLLADVELTIEARQRIAVVGRNGVGKSTLLKVISGDIQADSGEINYANGLRLRYLSQHIPDIAGSVSDIIGAPLYDTLEPWAVDKQVDKMLSLFNLSGDTTFNDLSGGGKRRVLMAQAFACEPDVLLLDEPTNHLDIDAIITLEKYLTRYNGSLIYISHDRQFIRHLSQAIIDIDRGKVTLWDCQYDEFLKRKADALHAEQEYWRRFDKKLAEEEVWIRQGIKARRTRNEGRVRALKALRQEKAQQRKQLKSADFQLNQAQASGKKVMEVTGLSYAPMINQFDLTIMAGDRIGIIGPNGCGKSTLVKLLLKQLSPQHGKVKHGTQLKITYFDQLREQIRDDLTVVDNVAEGSSHIDYLGRSVHVMSYLQNFLFPAERTRVKAGVLSGGERNRLLLAKLFTKTTNFLCLDEPTNDLDLETLELLEELLANFNGTLLLVSHDREFINNIATSVLVFEQDNQLNEYVGGYDDYLRQRKVKTAVVENRKTENKTLKKKTSNKLSYNEQRELRQLPDKIASLEQDIENMQNQLADPNFYQQQTSEQLKELSIKLADLEQTLQQAYERWEFLEAKD